MSLNVKWTVIYDAPTLNIRISEDERFAEVNFRPCSMEYALRAFQRCASVTPESTWKPGKPVAA